MKPQIANIINFVRGVEPRNSVDLVRPVKEQLALLKRYGLTGTFLMQFDSLINPAFVELLSMYSQDIEIGGWLEIVQPMCEAAGVPWRGRPGYSWDWHANVAFTVGYSKEERIALVDVFMQKFKEIWGYYPKSVGSWIIDAYTLAYLSDKYGIVASCNCKDQLGTDGYTLWGGYYSHAYYPSRNNVLCPAQTIEQQIPVPIFRMLGSDPIYQYDIGLDVNRGRPECQQVITLEPVYNGPNGGGGVPGWVDWFFQENYNGICLSFGYAQIGQENSFGWEAMKDGLTYQIEKLAKLSQEGTVIVQTLSQTGEWFRNTYALTPASAVVALTDWRNEGRRSVWYNCRNYRVNFVCENNSFWIRDIYRFDENYAERYIEEICDLPVFTYDNLPVIDGYRWSGHGIRAGIYSVRPDGGKVEFEDMEVWEQGESLKVCWKLKYGERISCLCRSDMLEWQFPSYGYGLHAKADPESVSACIKLDGERLNFRYRGFDYSVKLEGADINAQFTLEQAEIYLKARGKNIQMRFV
ncbi:hypothetical protein JOD02_000840 [Caldicoprobacter guelmensis]|uniref:hypothetical protein n=1 Tax=Caldicoprobacter guelmensis TaxID=1170224 RepID=UPI00195D8E11|nr:hypothetical protein [Caldicoprobacter guelmensis]MBM7582003.1 hypothetical protein [Caldicoprobacter guelmensis]